MAKAKTKKKERKLIKRKPKVEINVLETAFIRWAIDRDNPVCMTFDILGGIAMVYGLWFQNLYAILVAIVAVIFGHSIARSKRK